MTLHLTAELEENYARFIRRSLEAGSVWVIESGDAYFSCVAHNGDQPIIPLWSDAAYARRALQASGEEGWEVQALPLGRLLGETLGGLQHDDALVGPNYTADMAGLELDPREVFEALRDAMTEEQRAEHAAALESASILTIGHPPEKLERRARRFAAVVAFDPDATPAILVRGDEPVRVENRARPGNYFIPLWSTADQVTRALRYAFGSEEAVRGVELEAFLAMAETNGWSIGVEPTIGLACQTLSAPELRALLEEAEQAAEEADDEDA